MKLTENLILSKTKADSLLHVKNLNMWGQDLSDVSILREMPNVEVLSLSVNKISTLADFGFCPKLAELYLRKNEISDINEIRYLMPLRNLRVLWLSDNPCSTETPAYRQIVVKSLPDLQKLDNQDVTPEERAQAARSSVPVPAPEDQSSGRKVGDDAPHPFAGRRAVEVAVRDYPMVGPSGGPAAPMGGGISGSGPGAAGGGGAVRGKWASNAAPNVAPAARAPIDPPEPRRDVLDRDPARKSSVKSDPAPTAFAPPKAPSNVMVAILALLNELDDEKLRLVRTEIDQKLASSSRR